MHVEKIASCFEMLDYGKKMLLLTNLICCKILLDGWSQTIRRCEPLLEYCITGLSDNMLLSFQSQSHCLFLLA